MEIPSSSPNYTPVNGNKYVTFPQSALLCQVLFPEEDIDIESSDNDDLQPRPSPIHSDTDAAPVLHSPSGQPNIEPNFDRCSTAIPEVARDELPNSFITDAELSSLSQPIQQSLDQLVLHSSHNLPTENPRTVAETQFETHLESFQERPADIETTHQPRDTLDGEETIFSDNEDSGMSMSSPSTHDDTTLLTQEIDPQKTTQNYLEELVTESLLESLPLPPAKRAKLMTNMGRPATSTASRQD